MSQLQLLPTSIALAVSAHSFGKGDARGQDEPIVVLLVDDQPIFARTVADVLGVDSGIQLHFCDEPLKAVSMAEKLTPTVILQDLAMPGIDGLSLLKIFRTNPATRETPIIVLSNREDAVIKAQAFACGANDYLVKLPDRIELVARIRHHSRGHIAQLQRDEAYRELAQRERIRACEIAHAARYVQSLLPPALNDGPVRIAWRFVPSTQLGGDAFGYRWLDERQVAIYVLDVSGHGIGSSLLAVSLLNILSHGTLANTNFHDPSDVMRSLNNVFSMNKHDQHFFTIWYGVYDIEQRTLSFVGGGHPPALLFGGTESSEAKLQQLCSSSPPIGVTEDATFENTTVSIPVFARMLLYSDGVVEVGQTGGELADAPAFIKFVAAAGPCDNLLERVLERAQRLCGGEDLNDDCSLIQVDFV